MPYRTWVVPGKCRRKIKDKIEDIRPNISNDDALASKIQSALDTFIHSTKDAIDDFVSESWATDFNQTFNLTESSICSGSVPEIGEKKEVYWPLDDM